MIEGMVGAEYHRNGGCVAMMTKVHRIGLDGMINDCRQSDVYRGCVPPTLMRSHRTPVYCSGYVTGWQIPAGGFLRFAIRSLPLANVLPGMVSSVIATAVRDHDGLTMARPFTALRTSCNARNKRPLQHRLRSTGS